MEGTEREAEIPQRRNDVQGFNFKTELNVWIIIVFSCFEIWALFCSLYYVFEISIYI